MGIRSLAVLMSALLSCAAPASGSAQASGQAPPAPPPAPPPAQPPPPAPSPAAQSPAPAQSAAPAEAGAEKPPPKLEAAQIEALVAPIALYPDPLLSQALMASTYPLEIVQAQQWLTKNSKLKGDELEKAVKAQDWEAAVQATVLVPDLLKRLAEDISWTTNLGNAFLAQQQDVMDAVQRLRVKAKDAGKLESNDKMKVETKVVEQQTVVVIEPASPEVIYVPAYNPTVVWGPPPVYYPYPPVYYPPPGAMLFTFSVGFAMGAAMHGGYCCGCGWGHNSTVVVNNNNTFVNNRNVQNNVRASNRSSNWQHSPQHRGGAPYGDRATANKYGGGNRGGASASTMDRGGGANRGGASASTMDRGGGATRGASASTADRGGLGGSGSSGRGGAGGGNYGGGAGAGNYGGGAGGSNIGNRSVPAAQGGSAFGGAGGGGNRATASSSRGASSMSGMRGGGGGGGRGGGGRGGGRR